MTAAGFVKKYLAGIGLLICLVVLSVFWGFYFRQAELIEKQQLYQGASGRDTPPAPTVLRSSALPVRAPVAGSVA